MTSLTLRFYNSWSHQYTECLISFWGNSRATLLSLWSVLWQYFSCHCQVRHNFDSLCCSTKTLSVGYKMIAYLCVECNHATFSVRNGYRCPLLPIIRLFSHYDKSLTTCSCITEGDTAAMLADDFHCQSHWHWHQLSLTRTQWHDGQKWPYF